jgi:hypothetical protein
MITTTGTSLETYLEWAKREVEKKHWGSVGIKFTVCNGQIVDVEKASIDKDHFQMKRDAT